MRRFFNVGVLAAAIALLLPCLAQAQTTGGFAGTVVKPDGTPVSFANVTLAGSSGDRQMLTDEEGRFVVEFLAPGKYTVTIMADGFGTLTDEDVAVQLGQRASRRYELQPVMEESMQIEAPEEAPPSVISNTTTTTTGANISAEIAESIPLGRNISNVLFLAPNVKSGGGTGSSNPSIGGSSGFENNYVFDGIKVTNAGYGALGSFSNVYGSMGTGINFNFVKETQVITNGFQAEFGEATGGIVNLITKSGTNEWDGSIYANYTPTGTQGNFTTPQRALGVPETLGVRRVDYGFDVGGPLIKDRLFFWLGANPAKTSTERRAPVGYPLYPNSYTHEVESLNLAGKLTLQITPDHRLDFSAFGDPSETNFSHQNLNSRLRVDEDRFTKLETGYRNLGLNYHGQVTPKFFIEGTLANSNNTFKEFLTENGNQAQGTDLTASQARGGATIPLGGVGYTEPDSVSDVTQMSMKFTNIVGNHEIKYGLGHDKLDYDFTTRYTGPKFTTRPTDITPDVDEDGDTDPTNDNVVPHQSTTGPSYQRRFDCSIDPTDPRVVDFEFISDPAELARLNCATTTPQNVAVVYRVVRAHLSNPVRTTSSKYTFAFVQDTYHATPNLHISAGLRWEKQSLAGNTIEYTFPRTLSPRVGVSWDHTKQGKAKLYGYWGRFYEKVPLDLAVRALSQEIDVFRGVYFDPNFQVPVPQGTGVGLRFSLGGTGATEIVGGTKNSYTDGTAVGYERDLGKGWGLKAEWQTRTIGDVLEDFSNVPMSDIMQGINTFGHYIIGNIPPDTPIETQPIDPADPTGPHTIAPRIGYPEITRDYQAVTFQGTHQSERWYFTAQYTLSNLHGNYEGLFRNDNGQSDPNLTSLFDFPDEPLFHDSFQNGTLNTNRTHRLQTYGFYNWQNGWSLGSRFVLQSGLPKLKLASHPTYENQGEISIAGRGEIGETPPEYNLDLNFGKKWALKTEFESSVEVSVDILNILNRQYATNWTWNYDSGVGEFCDARGIAVGQPGYDDTCNEDAEVYASMLESVQNGPADPDYGKVLTYVNPREVRFGVKWSF